MNSIAIALSSLAAIPFSLRPSRTSVPIAALLIFAVSAGARAEDVARAAAKDALIVRTLLRLPGVDLSAKPEAKAALLAAFGDAEGDASSIWSSSRSSSLRETKDELLKLAIEQGGQHAGREGGGVAGQVRRARAIGQGHCRS